MADPLTIDQLLKDRGKVIDLLCDARCLISGAVALMKVNKVHAENGGHMIWTQTDEEWLGKAERFLEAGLFGDRN